MPLKDPNTHFQKMELFVILSLTVSEILEFEVQRICLVSAESASFFILIANIS